MKYDYKTITLEDMVTYIEENAPQDKAWFKQEAFVKTVNKKEKTISKYNHLKAKRAFCQRYMPEIIPVAKEKPINKSSIIENW